MQRKSSVKDRSICIEGQCRTRPAVVLILNRSQGVEPIVSALEIKQDENASWP